MKRFLPVVFAAILIPALAHAAGRVGGGSGVPQIGLEARFGGVVFDENCWDDDTGAMADFGLTIWEPSDTFGLWIGVGGQGASYRWEDPWGEVESDVVAVPVGASLLLRLELAAGIALRAEAGARYVAMDIDDWDDNHGHHGRRRRDDEWERYHHPDRYLDVDDTSLAVVALQLEFALDPVRLAVGGGYQFDLEKPDVEYLDRSIGELDLSGAIFFVSVGVFF